MHNLRLRNLCLALSIIRWVHIAAHALIEIIFILSFNNVNDLDHYSAKLLIVFVCSVRTVNAG